MHTDLERLIDLAVADGSLTHQERRVLSRKAEALGIDQDELEMTLEAKLYLAQASAANGGSPSETPRGSSKAGSVKKCPSCGEPVLSFQMTCNACGHEFRGITASDSVTNFFNAITEAPVDQRASIIQNFPVPNTREDILEFLSSAIGNCKGLSTEEKASYYKFGIPLPTKELRQKEDEISAWRTKVEGLFRKATLLLKDDPALTALRKEHKRTLSNGFWRTWGIGLAGAAVLLLMGVGSVVGVMSGSSVYQENVSRENERLETIAQEVAELVDEERYDSALLRAADLQWQFDSEWASVDSHIESWDERRTRVEQAIREARGNGSGE